LGGYYIATVCGALLEGIGMLLLVSLLTGAGAVNPVGGLPDSIKNLLEGFAVPTGFSEYVRLIVVILGLTVVIKFGLICLDGILNATLRRRIQEAVFSRHLLADWAQVRDFRVGDAVGTTSFESIVVAKYLSSVMSVGYYLLGAAVMASLALATSVNISLVLAGIGLPLAILMKISFARQARLSKETALLRNQFSADITDRYSGLLQIQVDGNDEHHLQQGLRRQEALTHAEIKISIYQAVIGSFSILLPFTALSGFAIWLALFGTHDVPEPPVIASVGILGIKLASQLNGLVASIGNISRLSGSLTPVSLALSLSPKRRTTLIEGRAVGIHLKDVAFNYGSAEVLREVTIYIQRGAPFVLTGRSGRGKTTLANLLAGLHTPCSGVVEYVSDAGRFFDSRMFHAHIGFVTQDIYLFQGSLRSNLTSGRDCPEARIWEVLGLVDAAEFVRELGGLDVESAEAGRALSGGQRRRLGVAKVLLSGPDILIFDEITAGLDSMNRAAVLKMVESFSREYVVVMISHEEVTIPGTVTRVL
jgi:ABC-type multidrug transport system fused ATPase/permease subunit